MEKVVISVAVRRSRSRPPYFSAHSGYLCQTLQDFTAFLPSFIFMSLIWFVVVLEEFMSVFSSLHNVWEHFVGTRSLPATLNMSNINLNFAFSSSSSRSLVRYCALLRAETRVSNI